MTRVYQYLVLTLTGILGLFTCQQSPSLPTVPKPNILLILTDDMGFGDVAISGNTSIQTPELDKLASSSVRFSNFYVSPVCAPTRASLLTGRYHQRTGVRSVTNGYETMDPEEITLAEILKDHGYRTGIFGKWHLGEYYPSVPNAQGFDEYLGFRTGHTNNYYDAEIEHNGKPFKTKGHITDVLTTAALDFMTQNENEPFFCYLAYNAPHTPLHVDSSWWRGYSDAGLKEREARIYGLIEQLDHGIGQLIDTLKTLNFLDNTIVIFMSDNGPINGWRVPQEEMRFNAGLRDQKFTTYEGGIRTQSYWSWGTRWRPRQEPSIAAHIDVLPTILDILDIEPSESHPFIDGLSLESTLQEKVTPTHEQRFFFQKYSLETLRTPAPFPGGIARRGPWKMVNGTELYNLENDIGEKIDLSDRQPEILSEMKQAYLEWYRDISDDHNLVPITITIGHQEENPVYLQPHHSVAKGKVNFWGNRGLTGERKGTHPSGVDGDWTAGWTGKEDAISWDIEVAQAGDYRFKIMARDTTNQEPVEMKLSVNDTSIKKAITDISLNRNWNEIDLGAVSLEAGPCSLQLSPENELDSSLEIRALVIERL